MSIRNRDWLTNFAVSAASLVLVLALLEAVVRFYYHDEVDTESLRNQQATIELQQIAQPSRDSELYYELQPNLATTFRGIRVATSTEGYRIDLNAASVGADQNPEPVVRVALIGDSTSFGLGVEYAESYGEIYRRSMEARAGRSIELRNYSVPGYNALQELRMFETRVKGNPVDLVILHHDHNDSEPAATSMPEGYLHPEYGDNPLRSAAIKWLARRLRLARLTIAKTLDREKHDFIGGYVTSGPLFEAHLEARRELAREARHLGAPTVAVLFICCAKQQDDYEQTPLYQVLHKGLGAKLAGMGYQVLDLMPRYQKLMTDRGWPDPSPFWISEADRHPNPQGHAFIAEQLVEFTLQTPEIARVFGLAS